MYRKIEHMVIETRIIRAPAPIKSKNKTRNVKVKERKIVHSQQQHVFYPGFYLPHLVAMAAYLTIPTSFKWFFQCLCNAFKH